MTPGVVEIAVLGDLHGCLSAAEDAPLLAPYPLRLCTGDLAPNGGRHRFDEALRQAHDLAALSTWTILGNHDGPTCFTGKRFPKSYVALEEALNGFHVALRRIELPELDLTLVGGRPLTFGSSESSPTKHPVPGREDWGHARYGEEILALLRQARGSRIVVLAHDGPTGLGSQRHDIYGCDFRAEAGDWGDPDLRAALDVARADRLPIVAVIAGHMHHHLAGGGQRVRSVREAGVLHLNAALVPRVGRDGRALFVVRLEGLHASARLEWHRGDGRVDAETVA